MKNILKGEKVLSKSDIKLIAFDLDGTVLNEEKKISKKTREILIEMDERGVLLVPATGRNVDGIPEEVMSLLNIHYAITSNGAIVENVTEGIRMRKLYIDREVALKAYDMLQNYDCIIDLYSDSRGYTIAENLKHTEEFVPENLWDYIRNSRYVLDDMRKFIEGQEGGVEKLSAFFRTKDERRAAWVELAKMGLEITSSIPNNMEINANGANKGMGLRLLCETLNIPLSQTLAFGDGLNDIEMIKTAGIGIAMENAVDALKEVADYITKSNDEDGIYHAIQASVL